MAARPRELVAFSGPMAPEDVTSCPAPLRTGDAYRPYGALTVTSWGARPDPVPLRTGDAYRPYVALTVTGWTLGPRLLRTGDAYRPYLALTVTGWREGR
jgi:hypothetical protein